jgi:hypothetical protein
MAQALEIIAGVIAVATGLVALAKEGAKRYSSWQGQQLRLRITEQVRDGALRLTITIHESHGVSLDADIGLYYRGRSQPRWYPHTSKNNMQRTGSSVEWEGYALRYNAGDVITATLYFRPNDLPDWDRVHGVVITADDGRRIRHHRFPPCARIPQQLAARCSQHPRATTTDVTPGSPRP